jgi:hypothetical protein
MAKVRDVRLAAAHTIAQPNDDASILAGSKIGGSRYSDQERTNFIA